MLSVRHRKRWREKFQSPLRSTRAATRPARRARELWSVQPEPEFLCQANCVLPARIPPTFPTLRTGQRLPSKLTAPLLPSFSHHIRRESTERRAKRYIEIAASYTPQRG